MKQQSLQSKQLQGDKDIHWKRAAEDVGHGCNVSLLALARVALCTGSHVQEDAEKGKESFTGELGWAHLP